MNRTGSYRIGGALAAVAWVQVLPQSQDPASLSRLRPLVAAPPAPWWPLAPGVWVLAATVAIGLTFLAWRGWQRWRRDAWRRAALAELTRLRAAGAAEPERVSALLKRAAIAGSGRAPVAALSGEAWLAWLDDGLGGEEFRSGVGRVLGDGQYAPASENPVDRAALCALAERWIRRRRPSRREEPRAC